MDGRGTQGITSCLPEETCDYFRKREEELRQINEELDRKRKDMDKREAEKALEQAAPLQPEQAVAPAPPPRAPGGKDGGGRGPLSHPSSAVGNRDGARPGSARRPSTSGGRERDNSLASGSGGQLQNALGLVLGEAGSSFVGGDVGVAIADCHPEESAQKEKLHNTVRLQKARILSLEEDLINAIRQGEEARTALTDSSAKVKKLEDEVKKLQKIKESMDTKTQKAQETIDADKLRISGLEKELSDAKAEIERQKAQGRKTEAERVAKETRLNRLTEENERLKAQLKEARATDRDRGSAERQERERLAVECRKLERQRSELVAAFKKQMRLIDVLKRQRAHVEAARVLSFTEDEFVRALDIGDRLHA
uniref:Testis-expressed sequence 9 protein n=1 Tax=Chromera velia CCMP2878 TaxID=1169474 RepID=A0A0G4HMH2_9ALVE|mmetsp:Transcript_49549/g.97576  ORF Transcript_49549/g.97576 Transcript_49549/m.97576 type:complete len:367 (+) Transcript_49549:165-1265(+)|eukprot:Cvel_7539.t1-p1 / transcript=Cvel_7539.t1 / gene=Cvel_7539 / organism=Chromera_velia_CCMP2878 / gene_product=Testis-expressed sequence 9 protein, putative / transcript_product=Testis-expressed sequence 9 protein, putative / location=Cvel_scaffold396:57923-62260(-) / protein_length=366 / sequence_SO=supercontig / SO=protein_coding / is_pseudo=false